MLDYQGLMAYAKDPSDVLTHAFAGAIGLACADGSLPAGPLVMGLSRQRFSALVERHFPGAWQALFGQGVSADGAEDCLGLRDEEFGDLLGLLLEHRADDGEQGYWLACAIATSCLGNNHLWQDMGLGGRQDLSDLLRRHFPSLFAKNTANMKWKKFFYKQLCERAEVNLCKAPSCRVCDDYAGCFGPEEASAPVLPQLRAA